MADKYSKGGTVHRTKTAAKKIQEEAHSVGMKAKIVKVAGGYRVDKVY